MSTKNDKNNSIKGKTLSIKKNSKNDLNENENKQNKRFPVSYSMILFKFSNTKTKIITFIGIACSILFATSVPISRYIIGEITVNMAINMASEEQKKDVINLTLYLIYLAIVMFFLSFFMMFTWIYTGKIITKNLREIYIKNILDKKQEWFDMQKINELTIKFQYKIDIIAFGVIIFNKFFNKIILI